MFELYRESDPKNGIHCIELQVTQSLEVEETVICNGDY